MNKKKYYHWKYLVEKEVSNLEEYDKTIRHILENDYKRIKGYVSKGFLENIILPNFNENAKREVEMAILLNKTKPVINFLWDKYIIIPTEKEFMIIRYFMPSPEISDEEKLKILWRGHTKKGG